METIEIGEEITTDKGTFRVRLEQDEDAESPRSCDCNLATMVLSHRRYDLPREGDSIDRIEEAFERGGYRLASRYLTATGQALAVLPVYGYDHSGLQLRAGDPYSDPWDSGLAGLVYVAPEAAKQAWGDDVPDDLTDALQAEVEEYNRWATGEVYGYIVERQIPACEHCDCEPRWEEEESVWGHIGTDYAEQSAKEALQSYLSD